MPAGADGATGSRRIKVAHNFPRSVFKHPSKRCNSNDANSRFEAAAGELRATLPRNHACDRPRGPDLSRRGPARIKDWNSRPPTHIRIGNEHPDRLITYPDTHNLSRCAQPIRIGPEGRSSPVEWCNRFVSFGVGYALSWSGGSSCWVGWGVSRDLVRMSRLR